MSKFLIEFTPEQKAGLEKLKTQSGAPITWHVKKAINEYLERYLAIYQMMKEGKAAQAAEEAEERKQQ